MNDCMKGRENDCELISQRHDGDECLEKGGTLCLLLGQMFLHKE